MPNNRRFGAVFSSPKFQINWQEHEMIPVVVSMPGKFQAHRFSVHNCPFLKLDFVKIDEISNPFGTGCPVFKQFLA